VTGDGEKPSCFSPSPVTRLCLLPLPVT
jgi:hypothetical protein